MNISACCKKPLILAVDDNQDNLLLLEYQLLEFVDCTLAIAVSGQAALKFIESKLPDLVLMDILMPGMEGTEVVRRLKQSPRTAEIPIIAMTALARHEDRNKIFQAGCNDYICKPYELEELQTVILRHLARCFHL